MALKNLTQRQRLTERTELTNPVGDDLIHVVDVSDTTDSTEGTSKKMKISSLPVPTSTSTDNIPITLTTTASDRDSLATWLNTQNPPIEITANQIPEWELTDGTRYRFEKRGKGIYGVGQTQVVAADFKLTIEKQAVHKPQAEQDLLIEHDKDIIINGTTLFEGINLNILNQSDTNYPDGFSVTIIGQSLGINVVPSVGVSILSKGGLFVSKNDVKELVRISPNVWVLQTVGSEPKQFENNTTVNDLSNPATNYYTKVGSVRTANNATSYSLVNTVLGGTTIRLINTTTEPVVTGATKVHSASAWIANTDMYMVTTVLPDRVEYFFIKVA